MSPSDRDRIGTIPSHGHPEPDTLHGFDAGAPESDDLTVGSAASGRRVGSGLVLFTLLGVAAVASLWSMRAIGRAAADAPQQTEAGRLVESYLRERSGDARPSDSGLAAESLPIGDASELQIPREHLARDPFASPWSGAAVVATGEGLAEETVVAPATAAVDREARIAAWQTAVDEGAHDFMVESVLIAADPKMSIVSMNGGVFRVGEHVMFPDRPIRFEIVSVEHDAVMLLARNDELELERMVKLVLRLPQ